MDWLPEATRDEHARSFPWQESAPTKGVLHTTETVGWPGYDGWTIMPHATVMPFPGKGVIVRQHLPFSQGSFALVHAAGEEPTNGAHAFQFELVGTCDKSGPHGAYYWPAADDQVLLALYQKVIRPLSDAFGIPLHTPAWKPYPNSYGDNGVRLGWVQWHAYSGWCGHEHVVENDHGDPGNFPWSRLIALANPPHPDQLVIYGPVRYGDTGSSVRIIQKKVDHGVTVDGTFGRETLIGVENYQKRHDLTADGIVGPKTAAVMGVRYLARLGAAA